MLTDTDTTLARRIVTDPASYLHRPGLVESAFLALKYSRGQVVRHHNLGPARYRFTPAACAPDLIARIRARAEARGHRALRLLVCKEAVR